MRGELEDAHDVGGHQAAAEAEAERLLRDSPTPTKLARRAGAVKIGLR